MFKYYRTFIVSISDGEDLTEVAITIAENLINLDCAADRDSAIKLSLQKNQPEELKKFGKIVAHKEVLTKTFIIE